MPSKSHETPRFSLPKRLGAIAENIWIEYVQLDREYKPANLGIGYADYLVTEQFNKVLAEVAANADSSLIQYAPPKGHPRLLKAVAALYGRVIGRNIDPFAEVLITIGGMEALSTVVSSNIDEGDEVIIVEPFFASYEPIARLANGKVRFVQLKMASDWKDGSVSSADFVLDEAELRAAFNENTKMIILNTPNNPLGKVFSREELQKIADLCQEFNVICVSDEAYEWMVYEEAEHIRICTLPGMWDRTITIGSAGKALTLTGWRTGWAYGSAALIQNMSFVHTNAVYASATPLQEALGIVIEREIERLYTPESYFVGQLAQLKRKRDILVKGLREVGMKVVVPQGGYFIVANWADLECKADLSAEMGESMDFRFTKWLIKNVGVMAIPPTAFFHEKHKAAMETFARFCFFKQDETLQKAIDSLRKWTSKFPKNHRMAAKA